MQGARSLKCRSPEEGIPIDTPCVRPRARLRIDLPVAYAFPGFLQETERGVLHDLMVPLIRSRLTRREARMWLAALHTLGRGHE